MKLIMLSTEDRKLNEMKWYQLKNRTATIQMIMVSAEESKRNINE